MSDTPVQTASAGEAAPVNEFNTVTWAEDAPKPVEAAPVTPEPVTQVEPTNPDINIVTLENGTKEVRLASGEVFKGKDDAEVIQNLAKSKLEATRHIQNLRQPAQPVQPAIDPNKAPVDTSSQVLLDLLAPSLGAKDGASLAQTLQQQQQIIQEFQMQQTAAQFFQEVPDFPKTQANTDKFGQTLDEFNLPFTVANAKLVHGYLKSNGMYQAVPARTEDGKFAPRANTMPAPPNGTSAPQAAAVDEAAIWKMSPQEFQEYRAKFATQ